jgi:hypothetical protein
MAKEIVRERELMNGIIAKHTGQPIENVAKDTDRDFILTAVRAVEYRASAAAATSCGGVFRLVMSWSTAP